MFRTRSSATSVRTSCRAETGTSRLMRGLVDEGVLAQDLLAGADVVRLSYQRLSDHLQAVELLEANDDEGVCACSWQTSRRTLWGSMEGPGCWKRLPYSYPKKRGHELHNLVTDPRQRAIQDAFLESIIWRRSSVLPRRLASSTT